MPLRFLTAGESHGPALLGILDGLPTGMKLSEADFIEDLSRRQRAPGRGGRQRIEKDRARILGGLAHGRTTGAPLALLIENLDFPNWDGLEVPPVRVPRPGHADLAGCLKWGFDDTRLVSERASARETAMRVALGVAAKALLAEVGIRCAGKVVAVGGKMVSSEATMRRIIDRARTVGETLGGTIAVSALGVPPGLGSSVQWDRKLDGLIARALMSIPSVKGVLVGEAAFQAGARGSRAQDPIRWARGKGFTRPTNLAGGIEGGISNGEAVSATLFLKPISTLKRGLASVDLRTRRAERAAYQRSDTCVVPAAVVIAEAMLALVLAEALMDVFGADRVADLRRAVAAHRRRSR